MAALPATSSASDDEAIALNLEGLLHIACFSSQVPTALLILHQGSVYRIVCQVGQQIDALQLVAHTLSPLLPIPANPDNPASSTPASAPAASPHGNSSQDISINPEPTPAKPLEETILSLKEENRHLQLLQNLSFALQSCGSLDEVYETLPDLLYPFRTDMYGQVVLSNLQQNQVLKLICWGKAPHPSPPTCLWSNCPVVLSHQPYKCNEAEEGQPNCKAFLSATALPHSLPQTDPTHYRFCAPITTPNGQTFGVLSFWHSVLGEQLSEIDQRSMVAIAQHIALTLERLRRIEVLQHQSIRDPLTGLFNRLYLKEMLPQLMNRAEHNQQPISIIMIDIDHFKRFNDQHGHQAGDQVLRDFSVFLKGFVRATDLACRYGGEEFILILPEVSQSKAQQIADRIRHGLQYVTMQFAGRALGHITLSAGVATFPQHGTSDEAIIAAADAALYRSKMSGRNRITVAKLP